MHDAEFKYLLTRQNRMVNLTRTFFFSKTFKLGTETEYSLIFFTLKIRII